MTRKKHDKTDTLILKSPYKLPVVKRNCMKCQNELNSLGPMNRICPGCNY